ncbi:MAG: DUF2157 domain-containing protein [Opitutae bacterium]|nr:DUF2157 domain-containing protein [Opitutae bacterium]
MNKHSRWLLGEIERWTEERLITPEQAATLRSRYTAEPAGAVPWGLLVFATAGAIVIGLGVILLFAYNWDEIPKAGKLALVFGAIIATHAGGLRLRARAGWQPKLGEALAALGTMFYGAGIWLVAQIYNIDEHYPNGFLFWALGALAMAWAIRSTANGLLAVVLLAIWGCCETTAFHQPEYWSALLVAGGVVTLAWAQRSALLLTAALAALQLLIALNLVTWGSASHAFTASLALGVLLVAAARLTAADRPDFAGGAAVMSFFGYGAFLVCAYLLSFHDAVHDLLNWSRQYERNPEVATVFGWSLFTGGLAGWLWLLQRAFSRHEAGVQREEWLLPIALLYGYGLAATDTRGWELFVSWSFNLVLLSLAIMWMWRGCQQSRLRPTVLGSLLLSAVVLARYFDLFHSLAARGLAFIVLGGIFVAEAMYYRKVRRETGGAA